MSKNMWSKEKILHRLCLPTPFPPSKNKWLHKFPHNNLPIQVQQFHLKLDLHIMMANSIDLTTWEKSYEKQLEGVSSGQADPPLVSQSNGPLTLEKLAFEALSRPSKGALRCTTHNLNARASQHYNIVEDLSQALCAMSVLEVLQSFPTQQKALLTAIGAIDSADASLLFFDPRSSEPRLPHTISL